MKLIDLISTINENDVVKVYDTELTLIATADGKDSIPENYNNVEVVGFHPANAGELNVEVKIEGGKAAPILYRLSKTCNHRITALKEEYSFNYDHNIDDRWMVTFGKIKGYADALFDAGLIDVRESRILMSYMKGEDLDVEE